MFIAFITVLGLVFVGLVIATTIRERREAAEFAKSAAELKAALEENKKALESLHRTALTYMQRH